MTAPSLRSLGTVWVGPTTTPSFAEPAGAVSTDIIEIIFFLDGTNTVTAAPTGFATATAAPAVNTNHSLQVYWARRSAAGAGPYAFTLASSTHVEGRAAAIQDCITTGNPYEAANSAISASASTAPAVSATSTGADRYASYAATNWSGGAWTPPSGFTEQWDANNHIATYDDAALPTATTVTPQAVCASTDKMSAWVGIFLPASGSTPITLTETGTGADAATVAAALTLADTAAGADAFAVAAQATLAETAAALDSLTVTASLSLTDTGAGADGATAGDTSNVAKALADTATARDRIHAYVLRPNAGTVTRPNTGTVVRPFTGIVEYP